MEHNELNYNEEIEEVKAEPASEEIKTEESEEKEAGQAPEPESGQESEKAAMASAEPTMVSDKDSLQKKSKKDKPKRKHGFLFRAVRGVACALLLGAVAGASFYGAVYAGYVKFPTQKEESTELSNELIAAIDRAVREKTGDMSGTKVINVSSDNGQVVAATVIDVSDIVKNVITSVVAINGTTSVTTSSFGFGSFWGSYPQTYEAPCSGSGIIIGTNDTELLVVTNAHVVEDVNNLQVSFCDGTSADAVIKGIETENDLAVVAVKLDDISRDTMTAISVAKLGTSDDIEVGEAAIAIGNAVGYGISVTTGIVSAVDRSLTVEGVVYDNLIQTDAAINPGNSGGALFNAKGEVIGINSVKMSDTKVEGMGYAISIESVKDIIDDLSTQTTRTALDDEERGYLGVSGNTVTSDISSAYGWPEGVLVRSVSEGSAAEKAGITVNDVITSFDGKAIDSWEDLVNTMQYYQVGETIEVAYYHLEGGTFKEMTVEVTLTAKPENSR